MIDAMPVKCIAATPMAAPVAAAAHRPALGALPSNLKLHQKKPIAMATDKMVRPTSNRIGIEPRYASIATKCVAHTPTPSAIDAVRRTGQDNKKADISENTDERGNQDKSQIVLIDDALEDAEHACSPWSPPVFCLSILKIALVGG
jgi:hypothetical protein